MNPQVLASLGVLLLIYLMWVVASRKINPLWLAIGADGRLSTSKFQFLVWTAVSIFTFAVLNAMRQGADTAQSLPQNLLIAMGLSLTTTVAAKGITVSYVTSGRVVKDASAAPTLSLSYLVTDDDGMPDLTKVQMLAWTAVGIATYLLNLSSHFGDYAGCKYPPLNLCYPDIDSTLMVLMGLGQGAYVGFKLVQNSGSSGTLRAATLTAVTATRDVTTKNVTVQLSGTGLHGATLSIDGDQVQFPVAWTDHGGSFALPLLVRQLPTTPGRSISLIASVNGQTLGPVEFVVPL